eukprot:CAMPEP_0197049712 /NCGR_PEP_ID=MMETSP1384-20130603/24783_1 /TAXON_ID=29189 /ORGANISM="Ammonia sp." /LENGTH=830 /DNA_ID=CAMNT_0042482035 /DNA_START=33 /DNA_END=2525 /DNA_ORIENTATION=+
MSQWSRKYTNNDSIEISEETQRYIKHLQFHSNDTLCLEQNEEDDITDELMTRIEMGGHKLPPIEVREARQVIQNWLQIENEAKYIRRHGTHQRTPPSIVAPSAFVKPSKMSRSHSVKTNVATDLRQKHIARTSSKKQASTNSCTPKKRLPSKTSSSCFSSSSVSAFDAKFAKMKSRAIHRAKQDKFERYKQELLSAHQTSKLKTKQMVENAMEFKEEEVLHNAEQNVRHGLIPSSRFNKQHRENQAKKDRVSETKKVLLFQLQEIEKQERFHDKKLLIRVVADWRTCVDRRKQRETDVAELYRRHLLKRSVMAWREYAVFGKKTIKDVFREWVKQRLLSQHNEIKGIEFFECRLQENVFLVWRGYTKQNVERRRIREMQLNTRLRKMNKIATRHFEFGVYCKIIKSWKEYLNDEQTKRFLEQQRKERKMKIQKLISCVKENKSTPSRRRRNGKNQETQSRVVAEQQQIEEEHNEQTGPKIEENKSPNVESQPQDMKRKKMVSHSIQTQTELETEQQTELEEKTEEEPTGESSKCVTVWKNKTQSQQHKKRPLQKACSVPSLKPSKLVIKMEQRALERRQKRERLMETKRQKEKEYEALLQQQKQMEMEKIEEEKRMEKERKLKEWQQQQQRKEIESNKLKLSQLHYQKSLILYCGWIPWMQLMERNNLYYHRLVASRTHRTHKRIWKCWKSVIRRREIYKVNAKAAACVGRQKMSEQWFAIKVESKHWWLWREIILRHKMMAAMVAEKRRLSVVRAGWVKWQRQYEAQMTKRAILANEQEETAEKYYKLVLLKQTMKSWQSLSQSAKREKQKARTWRKVEVWLAELRANR